MNGADAEAYPTFVYNVAERMELREARLPLRTWLNERESLERELRSRREFAMQLLVNDPDHGSNLHVIHDNIIPREDVGGEDFWLLLIGRGDPTRLIYANHALIHMELNFDRFPPIWTYEGQEAARAFPASATQTVGA